MPGTVTASLTPAIGTHRDVVGMSEDAIGTERDDNRGVLLVEDPRDRRDNVLEGNLCDATVRQTEPLVTVRKAAECSPRRFILALANGSERFAGGRESVSDVALLAEGGVDQDEPEVWVIGMKRDAARSSVRVVVRMREDASEGPVAGHDWNLSAVTAPSTGPSRCETQAAQGAKSNDDKLQDGPWSYGGATAASFDANTLRAAACTSRSRTAASPEGVGLAERPGCGMSSRRDAVLGAMQPSARARCVSAVRDSDRGWSGPGAAVARISSTGQLVVAGALPAPAGALGAWSCDARDARGAEPRRPLLGHTPRMPAPARRRSDVITMAVGLVFTGVAATVADRHAKVDRKAFALINDHRDEPAALRVPSRPALRGSFPLRPWQRC
jgi:hypothetical protein